MDNKLQPIISTRKTKSSLSSLEEKKVVIKGNNDFSRINSLDSDKETNVNDSSNTVIMDSDNVKLSDTKIDKRYRASMTQKISPAVNLKINTLKPFLGELENMPKTTVNEILNLLIDSYVNIKFSTRQQEAFNSMYNTQIDL